MLSHVLTGFFTFGSAAAAELDARGINKDSTQQKLAEVGQTMKDYGAVGQQRAGEYLQQAVDQVCE